MPAKREIVAAIKKIEREGYAPPGCAIVRVGGTKESYRVIATQSRYSLPGGKKAIYLGKEDNPKYLRWVELFERRKLLKEYKKALNLIEKGEQLAPESPEAPSVEWYTPPEWIAMARAVMGGIDLDPASNPIAQAWIKADRFYTKDDDGLAQPWAGRVWCNPPYGKFSRLFIERGLQFYKTGDVPQCIFMVNRTGAAWYVDLADQFDALCQVRKRISFLNPEGKVEGSPRYHNDILYLGPNVEKFVAVFSPVGRLSR